jgi:hypothetical protein
MSGMNVVGEWVCRPDLNLSWPRGETEPPITLIVGSTALSAS